MARNVRNSWVTVQVDGRQNNVETGPRAANGEMSARFLVRDEGRIVKSVTVETVAMDNGDLALRVFAPNGDIVYEHKTKR